MTQMPPEITSTQESPSIQALSPSPVEIALQQSRRAAHVMAVLTSAEKNQALEAFAQKLEAHATALLSANQQDKQEQEGHIAAPLFQRLSLDAGKIAQLAQGMRDLVHLPDPVGQTLLKTELDEGLILEKRSVPIGVIGIIFESRPDVIPQILSLILKSGNAVVLKGGREAHHSNHAFMALVNQLTDELDFLPEGWVQLLESREAVHEMLDYPQYVDLVIPRGSNQLVQSIMAATQIPVLGHADGVCHLYVHSTANVEQALPVILDAKAQYPSACNALETLLVDESIAASFLPELVRFVQDHHPFQWRLCAKSYPVIQGQQTEFLEGLSFEEASEADWTTEYGDLTLAVKVVSGVEEAIAHINQYGSHHTDGILAEEEAVVGQFQNQVDSASVFANASTRFADGFRYGFGAEIGISTARTHARGPVGLEGLVSYKYRLTGQGQTVTDYVGSSPKRVFSHRSLQD